jgi:hypothetical protein
MGDAVATTVLRNTGKKYKAYFTNVSDGTGESAVQKVDISGLTLNNGSAPTKVKITRIWYSISSGMSVSLLFDHTANDIVFIPSGDGFRDFETNMGGLRDPASAGGTGDLLFTTNGASAGDTYWIMLELENA